MERRDYHAGDWWLAVLGQCVYDECQYRATVDPEGVQCQQWESAVDDLRLYLDVWWVLVVVGGFVGSVGPLALLCYSGFILMGLRYGRKNLLCIGLVWLSAWSIAIGFGNSFIEVAVFRGLQGMGAAMTVPSAIGIISSYFVGPDRTRALSIYGASGAVGFCAGLIFGGFLSSSLGWKYIFRLVVIVTALLAVTGWFVLPKDRLEGTTRARLDYAGAALSTAGLILLSFVLSSGGVYGWSKPFIIALLIVSCAILVVFTLLEKYVKNPIMPLSLWKIRNFAGLWIAGFSKPSYFLSYGLWLNHANYNSCLWKLPNRYLLPCPHGTRGRRVVCWRDSDSFFAYGSRWLHCIFNLWTGHRSGQRQILVAYGNGSVGAGAGSKLSDCSGSELVCSHSCFY